MRKYFDTVVSTSTGKPLQNASVRVKDSVGDLAVIYSDDGGTPLDNPIVTDANGFFAFYAANGVYTLEYLYGGELLQAITDVDVSEDVTALQLAASDGSSLVGFLQAGAGSVARTAQAKLRDFANVRDFGALGNGSNNDTAAILAAIAAADLIHIPAGTWAVDQVVVPANKTIATDGFDTILAQRSGQASDTPIIRVTGSNVRIGDIALVGDIANQTGEWSHGIDIYIEAADTASRANITIGNVKATNIRGDGICVGVAPAAYAAGHRLSEISVGHVIVSNCYRNGVSVTGGSGFSVESVTGTVGYLIFDVEPDTGSGPTTGVRAGYIKGHYAGVVSPTAADYLDGIEIGTIELDPDGHGSTPAYPPAASMADALLLHNCKALRVGKFRAEDFNGQAIQQINEVGDLAEQSIQIDQCEIIDCCKTDVTYNSYIEGATAVTRLSIGQLTAATVLSTHRVIGGCDGAMIDFADIALVAGSSYMRACADNVTHVANITGGTALVSCTDSRIEGGTQNGEFLFSFCSRCVVRHSNITMSTSYDNSGSLNAVYNSRVAGSYYYNYTTNSSLTHFFEASGKFISYDGIRSRSATAGMGYEGGAGGTVVQATSKATGVTLDKVTGQITMNNAALAPAATVSFTLTSSAIAASDEVRVRVRGGATAGAYRVWTEGEAAGSRAVFVKNETAGSLSEAVVLGFDVWKGAIS